jgi:hypothetical protein
MTQNIGVPSKLNLLNRSYGAVGNRPAGEQFYAAFRRYLKANRESLFDLTLTAASAEGMCLDRDIADFDPRLVEAIRVTNPSLANERLLGLGGDEMRGAINSAKGKYFEYLVVDRLNAGEQVGPIMLPDGYRAELADSLNQPGWDMRIVGPDGAIADYLQLKATDSAGYIKEALHRYPDIKILATHEVSHFGVVLDSGITEDELRDQVSSVIEVMDDSMIERFLDYFSPLFPLVAIATWEGYKVSVGQQSLDRFKLAIARRGQRIVASNLVGAAVYAIGGGMLAIPAAFAGGLLFDRYWNQEAILASYRADTDRLLSMRLAQQSRLLLENDYGFL